MKIFYFIPSVNNPGGMERTLFLKVNYLTTILGYDVTIITTEKERYAAPFFYLSCNVKVLNFEVDFDSHFSKPLLSKFIFHKRKLSQYRKKVELLLLAEKPDICISLFGKEVDFLPKLKDGSKKIGEIHFAKDIREQFLTSRKSGLLWNMLGKIRTLQLTQAAAKFDHVVVLTQQDLEKWNLRNCSCIPNANPIETILTSTSEEKRVISVGRLDPQKGYDYLIEAWQIVYENCPDWSLTIFGDGYQREELQSRINQLGLQSVITLCQPTTEITSEYINSSLYVMSSRYEGLPMVLIEAMACGLPCISFDCKCGPRDIISHNIDGLLVPERDVDILAASIVDLIENREKRRRMSLMAIKKSKDYSIDKILRMWDELFYKL